MEILLRFRAMVGGLIAVWLATGPASAATPAWLEGGHPERVSSGVIAPWEAIVAPFRERPAAPQGSPVPVALDPRVGVNVVCGPDPVVLPTNLRSQAEPHIARHPLNPDVLLADFQDGRYVDGGAVTCGYAVSRDGGITWNRSTIPKLTKLEGGTVDRATDPVAAFSPDGSTWYLNTLGILGVNLDIGVLYLSRSTNQGLSFLPPVELYRSPDSSVFPDKNWMTVNPYAGTPTHGRIVVSFTRFSGNSSPIAVLHSDDDGRTWSVPVLATPADAECQGSQPVFLPDGRLAMIYWDFASNSGSSQALRVAYSPDGGSTWNPSSVVVSNITSYDDPLIRDGVNLPSAAADPTGGKIWASYQANFFGVARILVVGSADGGKTWGAPRVVSDNPVGKSVFNPALAVSADGRTVMVAFWDNRAGATAYQLDTWVAASYDGGTNWQPNLRITSVSTDVRLAPPTSRGYMIGDYFGLVAPADPFTAAVALTIDTREGEPQPMSARFGAAATLTFDAWRSARFSHSFITAPATGNADADPDGDGIELFAEYGFGTNPSQSDRPILIIHRAPGGLTLTFQRNVVASEARVLVEDSGDLVAWNAVPLTGVADTDPLPTMTLPVPTTQRFYRLRVVAR